jgi:nucleoside-diphosphate-sugar epimerase
MISLVTGGTGFIGSNLVRRLLEQGDEVRVISRRLVTTPKVRAFSIDYEKPNLGLDDQAFENVGVVYHLAGATRAASPGEFIRANATHTHRLIDRILATSARPRFVYVSSQAAAGPFDHSALRTPHSALTEDDPPNPIDSYGRSKLAAEEIVAKYAADLPWTIVRPSAVYGPGDRDFLPIFSMAKRGVAIYPGTQHAVLTTIFVDDLVTGLISAATSATTRSRTYFLGTDPSVRWLDIYHTVAKVMGKRFRFEFDVPIEAIQFAGGVGDLFGRLTGRIPLVNSDKAALAAPRYWVCSSAAAHRDFGFAPPTSLRDGLSITYKWYLQQGWL